MEVAPDPYAIPSSAGLDFTMLAQDLIPFFLLAFFAILFLQSGIDKVTDRQGNMSWLMGHFADSPLAGSVSLLLSILTMTELAAGVLSLVAAITMWFVDMRDLPLDVIAVILCNVNFLMLFFGQRMAKDYAGAAGIVPYFLTGIVAMVLMVAM